MRLRAVRVQRCPRPAEGREVAGPRSGATSLLSRGGAHDRDVARGSSGATSRSSTAARTTVGFARCSSGAALAEACRGSRGRTAQPHCCVQRPPRQLTVTSLNGVWPGRRAGSRDAARSVGVPGRLQLRWRPRNPRADRGVCAVAGPLPALPGFIGSVQRAGWSRSPLVDRPVAALSQPGLFRASAPRAAGMRAARRGSGRNRRRAQPQPAHPRLCEPHVPSPRTFGRRSACTPGANREPARQAGERAAAAEPGDGTGTGVGLPGSPRR